MIGLPLHWGTLLCLSLLYCTVRFASSKVGEGRGQKSAGELEWRWVCDWSASNVLSRQFKWVGRTGNPRFGPPLNQGKHLSIVTVTRQQT